MLSKPLEEGGEPLKADATFGYKSLYLDAVEDAMSKFKIKLSDGQATQQDYITMQLELERLSDTSINPSLFAA